jgi:hypothetical protein
VRDKLDPKVAHQKALGERMKRDLRAEMESWAQKTGSKKDQRAALVQIVLSGAMTFEQAKAEAAELERRWLIERVRDGDENPEEAEGMVLAWIMWRTADDVRRHWDKWRDEAEQWQLNGDRGHSLRAMERSSFSELRNDQLYEAAKGNLPRISAEQAKFELWQFLQLGKLTAYAINPSIGKRVPIKKHEFFDLRIVSEGGEDRLEPGGYQQPLLEREEVLRLWRKPSARNACLASAERKCREWLEAEMRGSLDQPLGSTKKYETRALAKFPGLSKEGFGRAWTAAIKAIGAHAWSMPGPRPKSPE